jgi:hypothetical protein
MSKKHALVAGVVLGAVVTIGLLVWILQSGLPGTGGAGTGVAKAADPPPAGKPARPSPRINVWDSAPTRKTPKFEVGNSKDLEVQMNAGRVTTDAGVDYYVLLYYSTDEKFGTVQFRMTADDAASLLRFYRKASDKKLAEDKEASWSSAYWICKSYYPPDEIPSEDEGTTLQVSRGRTSEPTLFYGKVFYGSKGYGYYFTSAVFDTLAETLKDVEAKKAAKPSPVLR